MNWIELILSAFGGATVALGAAGWLFRQWLTHRLSIEIETHKAQLVQKSEVLKTELSIYAHEQNVGLSRIDAQRSEAILSIWAVLNEWHDVFIVLIAPNQRLNQDLSRALPKYHERAKRLMDISNTLSIEVRNRAIIVDQATYEVIARCGKAITDVTTDFYAASFEGVDLNTAKDIASLFARVQQARENLQASAATNVQDFRSALVYEFRVLMKAEKVANLHSSGTAQKRAAPQFER
ncbi:MAG: hypothetical protein WDM70_00875 [Nitrosomonadales bacterium]